jgi:hypothetical protein
MHAYIEKISLKKQTHVHSGVEFDGEFMVRPVGVSKPGTLFA